MLCHKVAYAPFIVSILLDIASRTQANFVNLPSFTPPVRVTVGEVRYSIEIDVGGE